MNTVVILMFEEVTALVHRLSSMEVFGVIGLIDASLSGIIKYKSAVG